ncbi:hypothetical protein LWI28_003735 [Acer negundo]|uniref:Uncharacterized protein n=1 Tax=Acer negundo TaxID=4023 RepID=A0AAD5IQC2_ACENE|nr:hypothetical protein LWI28_003735 [Acer negundo]
MHDDQYNNKDTVTQVALIIKLEVIVIATRTNPLSISSSSSSRISTNRLFCDITNPYSPSTTTPWSSHSLTNGFPSSLSYANIVNGTSNATTLESLSSNGSMSSSAFPFYGNNNNYG